MIVPTMKKLKDREGGGHELLAYRNGRDGWVDVKAADINEYLKQVMGGDYSAKDFRTWNATVLAAVELAANGHEAETKTARKRAATAATKRVADLPLEHAGRLPQGLHRPARLRPLRLRRDDPASLRRMVAGTDPASSSSASGSSARCCARLPISASRPGASARPRSAAAVTEILAGSALVAPVARRRWPCPTQLGHAERSAGERRPEALLGLEHGRGPLADPRPERRRRARRPRSPRAGRRRAPSTPPPPRRRARPRRDPPRRESAST